MQKKTLSIKSGIPVSKLPPKKRFSREKETQNTSTELQENKKTKKRYQELDFGSQKYFEEVKNGMPDGTGILKDTQGNIIYEGEYFKGKHHGQGTYYYHDNISYKGEWKNDMHEGYGELVKKKNPDIKIILYEGNWKKHKKHGFGNFYDETTGDRYKVNWEDDFMHGKGTHYVYKTKEEHTGSWIKGLKEGLFVVKNAEGK
jgi:hypothetical protein